MWHYPRLRSQSIRIPEHGRLDGCIMPGFAHHDIFHKFVERRIKAVAAKDVVQDRIDKSISKQWKKFVGAHVPRTPAHFIDEFLLPHFHRESESAVKFLKDQVTGMLVKLNLP